MQKSKKRIIGAIGLASVAVMTIVAYNIPAAYAANNDVQLRVNVYNNDVISKIEGDIKDGSYVITSPSTIPVLFNHSDRLSYQISVTQGGNTAVVRDWTEVDLSAVPGATDQEDGYNGVYDLEIDEAALLETAGFSRNKNATFTLKVKSYGRYGGVSVGDAISFTFSNLAFDAAVKSDDENADPVVSLYTSDTVAYAHVVVKDMEGNTVYEGDVDTSTDVTNIKLPFAANDIASGSYRVYAYGYSASGVSLDSTYVDLNYVRPDGIGIPNTGTTTIAGLNIGRADYVASALLVLFLATVTGLYLMSRGKNSKVRK